MTVSLVTGAGGFVGGHLCRHLASGGVEVRQVSSRSGVSSWCGLTLLESREVDIAAALEGVDQVYFLAGIAHEAVAGGDLELLRRVNVEAPLRWLRAAERAGVASFVWLSSIKVLGDVSSAPLTAADPYRPGDDYARSKVAAEQRLLEVPRSTTELTVVRPPLVYGPGVRGNFLSLLRLAASSLPLPLARATAPRSLVAVCNLCNLLMRVGHRGGGIVHVADGEDVCVARLVTDMRRALGRSPRLFGLSPALLAWGLRLAGRADAHARLFEPLQVDIAATRTRFDWAPPRSAADALQETVAWFRTSR